MKKFYITPTKKACDYLRSIPDEEVNADDAVVDVSGDLTFYNESGHIVVVYASAAWVAFTEVYQSRDTDEETQMSYHNNTDLTTYFATVLEAEKLIETIPHPLTSEVLDNASLWGIHRCLSELSTQFAIMRRTLQDLGLEQPAGRSITRSTKRNTTHKSYTHMKFSTFSKLLTTLKKLDTERENYIRQLPSDISYAVYDNTYTNKSGLMFDAVLSELFDPFHDYLDDIYMFLYEPFPHHTTVGDKKYSIDNTEDYLKYVRETFDPSLFDTE